jgi:hypothetical protein
MTSPEGQGVFGRVLGALGRALERGILGRSGHHYMKQFAAGDQYWDRALAAQLGWPQKPPTPPEPDRFRPSGDAAVPAAPGVRDTAQPPPDPEREPVHGSTGRS